MSKGATVAARGGEREAGDSGHLAGLAMVATGQTVFGSMGLFYKLALAGGATTLTILAARFPLAAVPIWALILLSGRRPWLPFKQVLSLIVMGAGFYVGQSFFFLAALNYIPLSTCTLILLIYPALVLIGAVVMGRERVSRGRLAALGLSLIGCVLVIGGPGQGGDWYGIALALTSSLIYSGYILFGDRVLRTVDPLVASGYIIASAGLGFIVLSVAFADFTWRMTGGAWLAILVVAWFCTLIGVTGLLSGLSRIGPSSAAIVGMLEPLTAVILAVIVLGERLGPETVLGGVCILGAVFLLRKPSRRARGASLAALVAAERGVPEEPRPNVGPESSST